MRSRRVERLFEGDIEPPFRRETLQRLLWVAVPLDVLGILTCTGVVGLFVTLALLRIIDAERLRVEEGRLDESLGVELQRMRRLALFGLGSCTAGFVLQLWLLSTGFYEGLLMRL